MTKALYFLQSDRQILQFAIAGELLAIRTKNVILVYRDHVEYVKLRKTGSVYKETKWAGEDDIDNKSYPIAIFQPNERGWIHALGFLRLFGKEEIDISFNKEVY